MKKRGSALVVVLLTLTALLITGVAVYSYIVNTSKLNNNEMQKESIQTAAMSALNIGEYYLINDKNYKNINSGSWISVPNEYIEDKFNNNNFNGANHINEEYKLNSYNYDVNLTNNGDESYTVTATASKNNNKSTKESKVIIKAENNLTKEEKIDLFLKNSSGITLLNTDKFNVSTDSIVRIENSSFNIKGVLKSNVVNADKQLDKFVPNNIFGGRKDSYVYNTININDGMKRISGLDLKFGKKDADINDLGEIIKSLELRSWGSDKDVILLNNNGYKAIQLNKLNDDILKDYSAAVIAIDPTYDNYIILCNGNLTLRGELYNSEFEGWRENQFYIYSTDSIHLSNAYLYNFFTDDEKINVNMSLIAGNEIVMDNYSRINIKNILEKFTK